MRKKRASAERKSHGWKTVVSGQESVLSKSRENVRNLIINAQDYWARHKKKKKKKYIYDKRDKVFMKRDIHVIVPVTLILTNKTDLKL